MKRKKIFALILLVLPVVFLVGCAAASTEPVVTIQSTPDSTKPSAPTQPAPSAYDTSTSVLPPTVRVTSAKITPQATAANSVNQPIADVLAVSVRGIPGSYQFSVEISSQDLGCEQYADWWEVVDESGNLVYRRILAHSHVGEQPFTRSGGPVPVDEGAIVIVRAHMNPDGYGGAVLKGSIAGGFQPFELDPGFAGEMDTQPPLPSGCAF